MVYSKKKSTHFVFILALLTFFVSGFSVIYAETGGSSSQISPVEEEVIQRQKKDLASTQVRNLSDFPEVIDYLKLHKVYISMTTSPERLSKIQHVFETLDLEHVETVLVNLPLAFSRNHRPYDNGLVSAISHFPKVKILRLEKDLGPITKLLPGIEYAKNLDPKSIVITVDDDTGYAKGMINEMIYQLVKNEKSVVTASGQMDYFWGICGPFPGKHVQPEESENGCLKRMKRLLRHATHLVKQGSGIVLSGPELLTTHLARRMGLSASGPAREVLYSVIQGSVNLFKVVLGEPHSIDQPEVASIDMIEGYASVGYVAEDVDVELMKKFADVDLLSQVSRSEFYIQDFVRNAKSCFTSDDLVISFVLALSNVDRKTIQNKYVDIIHSRDSTLRQFSYGFEGDALHQGAGLNQNVTVGVNEQKYQDCYALLMQVSYDSQEQRFKTPDEISYLLKSLEVKR